MGGTASHREKRMECVRLATACRRFLMRMDELMDSRSVGACSLPNRGMRAFRGLSQPVHEGIPPGNRRQAGRTPYASRGSMPNDMKKIGLVMVLREGAPRLGGCLESVKAFIAHWIICDVGVSCSVGAWSLANRVMRSFR